MRLLAIVAVAVFAAPTAASATNRAVTISGSRFQPTVLLALVGDTVTWTNRDPMLHNATVPGSWTTGDLASGQTSSPIPLRAEGTINYLCTRHPTFMRATIRVAQLHLLAPARPVRYGRSVRLTGLAPAGSAVAIQRVSDGRTVATTTAGSTGAYAVAFFASPGQYRAVSGTHASAAVRVAVRPRVLIRARRTARGVAVTVSTRPAQIGARVALERARRGRWVRVARKRLDSRSRASFRLRLRGTARIRARLVRPVGGYAVAKSATITVRR